MRSRPVFHQSPVLSAWTLASKYLNQGTTEDGNARSAGAPGTWPIANKAIYVPVELDAPYRLTAFGWENGGIVGGTVDAGLYTADGRRLASSGVIAQTPATAAQTFTLSTPLYVDVGLYYLAMSVSTTGANYVRMLQMPAGDCLFWGLLEQLTAHPLPAQATFARNLSPFLPRFWAEGGPI